MAGVVLGLSKYLFSVQKDIGLCYLPEISGVLSSLSCILSGLEFEHEQLAGLKLLAFLIEWRHENGTSLILRTPLFPLICNLQLDFLSCCRHYELGSSYCLMFCGCSAQNK
jgi:hypothetical protein